MTWLQKSYAYIQPCFRVHYRYRIYTYAYTIVWCDMKWKMIDGDYKPTVDRPGKSCILAYNEIRCSNKIKTGYTPMLSGVQRHNGAIAGPTSAFISGCRLSFILLLPITWGIGRRYYKLVEMSTPVLL